MSDRFNSPIVPTVGRVVLVRGWSVVAGEPQRDVPALITRVWGDNLISVHAFNETPGGIVLTSVQFDAGTQDVSDLSVPFVVWRWMDYQVAKATEHTPVVPEPVVWVAPEPVAEPVTEAVLEPGVALPEQVDDPVADIAPVEPPAVTEQAPGANIHGIGPDTDGGPNLNFVTEPVVLTVTDVGVTAAPAAPETLSQQVTDPESSHEGQVAGFVFDDSDQGQSVDPLANSLSVENARLGRVRFELAELNERREKLSAFLIGDQIMFLDPDERKDLFLQDRSMEMYATVLQRRLERATASKQAAA